MKAVKLIALACVLSLGLFSCRGISKSGGASGSTGNGSGGGNGKGTASEIIYVAGQCDNKAVYWKITDGKEEMVSLSKELDGTKATSIAVSGDKVYVTGAQETVQAFYWVDGNKHELPTGKKATGIAFWGETFYISGADEHNHAVYWKNGTEKVELEGDSADANAIAVSGDAVYACGTTDDEAVYWGSNKKKHKLSEVSKDGDAKSITVYKSAVYTAGKDEGMASYWKNGEKQDLYVTTPSSANSIFIDKDGKVYVAGNNGGKATYWLNGVEQPLSSKYGSEVFAITVASGSVYIAGSNTNGGGKAVYWKDGTEHPLSCTANNGVAKSIFVIRN
ncbi:MAG: hypothetical protein ACTTIC_06045 [Helicobacteraceae bacterium]